LPKPASEWESVALAWDDVDEANQRFRIQKGTTRAPAALGHTDKSMTLNTSSHVLVNEERRQAIPDAS